jgi:hypothetical protein
MLVFVLNKHIIYSRTLARYLSLQQCVLTPKLGKEETQTAIWEGSRPERWFSRHRV